MSNLDRVLKAVPEDLHPIALANWLTRPEPILHIDDEEPVSPREWLERGGEVAPVATIAAELWLARRQSNSRT